VKLADSQRSPILYLVHRVPFPPDKGDRIRSFHILKFLSGQFRVHLATLADEPVSADTLATLRHHCERLAVVPLSRLRGGRMLMALTRGRTLSEGAFDSPQLRATLEGWCRETRYSACMVSASSLVPYLLRPELREVPALIDLVDVDSQKWLQYAASSRPPMSWVYHLEGRRLRELEKPLPSWARAVTLATEAEVDLYRQFCADGQVRAVGNGVDLEYFQSRPTPSESGCMFMGALDYRPNIDGVVWFCREVWPEIHRRHPQAKLALVGRNPAASIRRLAGMPGVDVVGPVPDVRPYYAQAAVVVAPLRIARGVQNKLLEALAMGKALVTTPQTLSGLKAEPGVSLLAAESVLEWQQAVLRLLNDSALRQQLGSAGRRYVEQNHRWDKCLEPLKSLLNNGK
jgi:sugar transferase (PEP-CTERM/EpsH1 system associated)